jgi:hypothetical protein
MSDSSAVHREAFWLLANRKIGSGIARTVYDSQVLKGCVIKVEDTSCSFQNVMEWQAWQRVSGTDWAKWFAPCKWISPSGTVLVMERTRPASPKETPGRLPVFLTDTKRENYGVLGKRFVCHDYGTNLLMEHGMTARTRKVEWWD